MFCACSLAGYWLASELKFYYWQWLELDAKARLVFAELLPWLTFLLLVLLGQKMYRWALQRKSAAFAFGMVVQMFLPDPNVQKTIEIVTEEKKHFKQTEADDRNKDE